MQASSSDGLHSSRGSPELPSTSGSEPPCAGPMQAPQLPQKDRDALRKRLVKAAGDWGYITAKMYYEPLKGMRVLDVGMGQGPQGVMALESGVKSYTGLDPALCISRRAKTRDKTIKRTPAVGECETIRRTRCAGRAACPEASKCDDIMKRKFKLFPFTGLDMMAAFPGKMQLLPGTFESLEHSGFLQRGMFDVALLMMVTEHLPDNRLVIEGVFKWLDPNQFLVLKHHNYYCYDGHHDRPQHPKDFDQTNEAQQARANWKHLEPASPPYRDETLNRIRLGDLVALVDVYFQCAWRVEVPPGPKALLQQRPELLASLTARGFSHAELLVNKLVLACARRKEPLDSPRLARMRGFHPPTNGSYAPLPLPEAMARKAVQSKEESPLQGVAGFPQLTKMLGKHR